MQPPDHKILRHADAILGALTWYPRNVRQLSEITNLSDAEVGLAIAYIRKRKAWIGLSGSSEGDRYHLSLTGRAEVPLFLDDGGFSTGQQQLQRENLIWTTEAAKDAIARAEAAERRAESSKNAAWVAALFAFIAALIALFFRK